MRRSAAILTLLVLLLSASAAAAAPGSPKPWQPDIRAALDYVHQRHGDIQFAVRTTHHFWGYRSTHSVPAASIVKAMCLVAYLDDPRVRGRPLRRHDHQLIDPMIQRSDDRATDEVVRFIGFGRLRALARRVGMQRFVAQPIWGRSHIDAADQSKLLLNIDGYVVARHRATALHLLASIIPPQRWGIAEVVPLGWQIYFKNGWGLGTGWVDHQVALLRRGNMRVAVAILTHSDGSHAYGKATLRGLARRLLRGLATAKLVE
jgi:beta-lactamase class A